MVILNIDHPDIVEFIECKMKEERKAHVLIEQGYDSRLTATHTAQIFFQNANHSVRVTDEFIARGGRRQGLVDEDVTGWPATEKLARAT